jgi:hypothetical protein
MLVSDHTLAMRRGNGNKSRGLIYCFSNPPRVEPGPKSEVRTSNLTFPTNLDTLTQ